MIITIEELATSRKNGNAAIPHRLQMALGRAQSLPLNHLWPANSADGTYDNPSVMPEGALIYFPSDLPMPPGLDPLAQTLFRTIQQYGIIPTDKTGYGVVVYAQAADTRGAAGVVNPYNGTIWDPNRDTWLGPTHFSQSTLLTEPGYIAMRQLPWPKARVADPTSFQKLVTN
jgi:hypothetical protein